MNSTYRVWRTARVVVFAVASMLWLAGVAQAQVRVEGVVRDAAGGPIANATVQLTTEKRQTVTDAEGRYHFDAVKPGQYIQLIVTVAGRTILQTYRLVTLAVEQIDLGVTPPPSATRMQPADRDRSQWTADRAVPEPQRPVLTEAQRKDLGVGGSGGIRGVVRSADGLGIPGAVVTVDGTDVFATTDTDGKFTVVDLRPGARVALVVSAQGFDDARKDAVVNAGAPDTMEITLNVATQGEFVTVSADVPMLKISGETSHLTLRPEQIASLPSLGEKDLFRAIQLLPGVTGTQEASSGLYVRGGTPDQNLVSLDGFTLYHVDHLFGYFSAFNMDAIDRVEFSKSAFNAADGGRLSGVLRMTGRAKAGPKPTGFVDVSALSVSGLLSSPIGSRGSFLITGRRSFQSPLYNNILGLFSNSGAAGFGGPGGGPSRFGGGAFSSTPASWFYDVNAKAELALTKHDKLSVSGYDGRDDLDNSRTLEIGRFTGGLPAPAGVTLPTIPSDLVLGISDLRNVTNQGAGVALSHQWGRVGTTTLSAGWSKFRSTRQQSNQLTLSSTGEDYSLDSGRGGSGAQAESNALSDVTIRFDNELSAGRSHRLSFGAEATSIDASYDAETAAVQGNGPGGFRSGLVGLLAESGRGRLTTGYLQDAWSPTARLVLTGGLRVTKYDVTSDVFMEPRVRANLQVTSRLQFKIGYGGYHQAVNRIAQEDLSQGDREFWLLSNGTTVPVSSAKQLAGGFSYETPGFLVDVETYHKRLDALTLFAPRLTPGVVPTEGDNYLYYGSGLARGLEALVQKKFGTHTGWVSYTLSRVEQTFPSLETTTFLATQDQTHELKVADSIKVSESWTMGASWIFGSGKPYTPATGVESVTLPIGVTVDRLTFGAKNSGRLPTYHRLDLSTQGDVHFFGVKGTLGLTVFNVYNRANVWYRSYQTFGGSGSVNDVTLMGRAINVFFKVGF